MKRITLLFLVALTLLINQKSFSQTKIDGISIFKIDKTNIKIIDSLANNYITLNEEGRNLLEAYSEELRKTHKLK